MAWTDLSNAFGADTQLTALQMQALRDNMTAFAAGAENAPNIQRLGGTFGGLNPTDVAITSTSYTDIAFSILMAPKYNQAMRVYTTGQAKVSDLNLYASFYVIGWDESRNTIFEDENLILLTTSFQQIEIVNSDAILSGSLGTINIRIRAKILDAGETLTIKNINTFLLRNLISI